MDDLTARRARGQGVRTGCVIMASGVGKRFGGNKLTARICGRPMIGYILDATEDMFDTRILVTRHAEIAGIARDRGVRFILHDFPDRSDAVRIGIEAMDDDIDMCMFCPSDQPLLTRSTIGSLIDCGRAHPDSICRIACGSRIGAPVLFPKWSFPELAGLPDGWGGGWIAERYPDRVRLCMIRDADEMRDVDTPDELRMLERIMNNRDTQMTEETAYKSYE